MKRRMTILFGSLGLAISWNLAASYGATPSTTPKAAPGDEDAIHEDGGIVYHTLPREAEKTGQLTRFTNAIQTNHELQLGNYHLRVHAPSNAGAYEVVPISYEISWYAAAKPAFPVAVEATAFENESRRKGRDLFDLALPGKIDFDVEYL